MSTEFEFCWECEEVLEDKHKIVLMLEGELQVMHESCASTQYPGITPWTGGIVFNNPPENKGSAMRYRVTRPTLSRKTLMSDLHVEADDYIIHPNGALTFMIGIKKMESLQEGEWIHVVRQDKND